MRLEPGYNADVPPDLIEFPVGVVHRDGVRRELLDKRWLMPTFAVASLNVAAWRGMTELFDEAKLFTEWLPLALCRPPA